MIYETIQLDFIKFINIPSILNSSLILKEEQPELGTVYSPLCPIVVVKNGNLQHIAVFGHEILTAINNDVTKNKRKYVVCFVVSTIEEALEVIEKIKSYLPKIISEFYFYTGTEMKNNKISSCNIKLFYIPISSVIFSPETDIDNIMECIGECDGRYLHVPIVIKEKDDSYELISSPRLFTVYTKIMPKDSKIPAFVISRNFYEQNKKSINKQIELIYKV